jgi:HPt (histidine-containing phosphotransfer) domain-containing protein
VRVSALHDALAAGDAPLARREAHTLKGASANVGAQALREAAHAAELACAAEALGEAVPLAGRVDAELERLQGMFAAKGGAA